MGLLILLILGFPLLSHAQQKDTTRLRRLQPTYINHEIKLTGRMDDPAWKLAKPVDIQYEIQPDDKAIAPVETQARVLYNKQFLYIGFVCRDPHPDQIRAHITDRDNDFQDDFVGAIIDPYDNHQNAYEFFVNPKGIQSDLMRTGNNEDGSFDALWYSKGAINDTGYTAVMAIPFKSLHFPNRDIQNWSVELLRNYPRSSRYQFSWSRIDLNNPCLMCQMGSFVDMKHIKNHNTVEVLPYVIGTQSGSINDSEDPTSGFINNPVRVRAGGSISYSPNSSLTLNAVVNPDFSQVETDATQISVNNTFAIFYPEKRPFFMEGSSLYSTNLDLFYSRMISDPLLAGKAVEKSGNLSFVYLTAYDRNSNFIIPGLEGSSFVNSSLRAYTNVIRPKYSLGSDSYIGGIVTTRNINQAHNYVASVDWNIKMLENYYFSGQYAYSNTQELNDTTLNDQIDNHTFGHSQYDAFFNGQKYDGSAFRLEFQRSAKYYSFDVKYNSFAPTFQAQEGYFTRTDERSINASQNFSYYPNNGFIDNGNITTSGFIRYDYSGRLMERWLNLDMWNQFKAQTSFSVSYLPLNDEQFRGVFFTGVHRVFFNLNSDALNALSLSAHYERGRYIYRSDTPSLGHGYSYSISATVKPTPRLNVDLSYNFSRLTSLSADTVLYSGDISRMVASYNFTSHLFVRMIGQYDTFAHQLQIYPLVYYKLNPFTIFYAGMTDYMNKFREPYGFKPANREFFVKFQYLIRS